MLGITNIGIAAGDKVIDNLSRAGSMDKAVDFIQDKIGFKFLRRIDGQTETSDLCVAAYKDLLAQGDIDLADIDCIVVCTQNPDGAGLPHTAAHLHAKLNAPQNVAAFDISLGCSGYIYGLSIVLGFMERAGFRKGLLFTADPYSKILDANDAVTELLFGDAASCTLLSDSPVYVLGQSCFGSNGQMSNALVVDPETKLLHMDGRAIFNFTMRVVPQQIAECLQKNGVTKEEVDIFLLHQASKYIIDNMPKRLGVPADKIPFLLGDVGNVVSSTIPFMLKEYLAAGPQCLLLSGFGVGLSWASTVIKRF